MSKKINKFFIIGLYTIFCVIVNFFFNHLVIFVLKVPLFLDTIGTVAVTFAFGWIPGAICAILTTFIDSLIGSYFLQLPCLYVLCSLLAVGITQIFKTHIYDSSSVGIKISYLFILSIIMCILISLLGGIIDSLCITFSSYKGDFPVASDYFKPNFFQIGFSQLGTNILSRLPVNIIDRPITVFTAYGAVELCKKIIHSKKDNYGQSN